MSVSERTVRTNLSIPVLMVMLVMPGFVDAGRGPASECRNSSQPLDGKALQHFGIRLRATETSDGYRIELKLQPTLCLPTSESDCGTVTYAFASADLNFRGERSPVAVEHPNDYAYTSSFQVDEDAFQHGKVSLTYRGAPCGDHRSEQHTFVIDLSDVADTAGRHYF